LFVAGLPFGPFGVAAGYSASFYLLILPALWYAGRPIDLEVFAVVGSVWKHIVSALAAAIVTWFVMHRLDVIAASVVSRGPLERIAASSALCMAAYLAATVSLHRGVSPISEFFRLVSDMIPRASSPTSPKTVLVRPS
jgi:PST family polysaccharide transporter